MSRRSQANRENAKLSTGPSDTSSTRYNAMKHGLLAEGVTELDVDSYRATLDGFRARFQPEGPVEQLLVDRLGLLAVRLRRTAALEAEFITSELNPPIVTVEKGILSDDKFKVFDDHVVVIDRGLPARLSVQAVDTLGQKFQRYEAALENRFFRTLNQLERLQASRRGDPVPPPVAIEVGVHGALASFGSGEEERE